MTTALATMVLLTPAVSASKNPTPLDHLRRPRDIQAPGALRIVHPARAQGVGFCVRPLRHAVRRLRASTWRWEDKLGVTRHRTERAEQRALGCAFLHWMKHRWERRNHQAWRRWTSLATSPRRAICWVFGRWCREALQVAWCESRYLTWASNGQHLGLFQMGTQERALYGHGPTALEQARAAWRYFTASGSDWSPWSCRP